MRTAVVTGACRGIEADITRIPGDEVRSKELVVREAGGTGALRRRAITRGARR